MSYILIVDDDEALRDLLRDILVDEGYELQIATSGSEALEMTGVRQPDVILFDITMPDLSGPEFVALYRQLPRATAGLIAISGIVNLAEEARQIEADGFIVKPFEIDTLLGTVARVLKLTPQ